MSVYKPRGIDADEHCPSNRIRTGIRLLLCASLVVMQGDVAGCGQTDSQQPNPDQNFYAPPPSRPRIPPEKRPKIKNDGIDERLDCELYECGYA